MLYFSQIFIYCFTLFGSNEFFNIFTFRCEHHECHTKDCIGTGCENFKIEILSYHLEIHFSTLRTSNPVALCFFKRVGPVDCVKTVEKTLCISRHTQTPLVHHLLLHRISTTYRHTLAHLVVGKHCAEFRTPVDHCLATISNTVVHQHVALLLFAHCVPFGSREVHFLAACSLHAFRAVLLERIYKFVDALRLVCLQVIVTLEHFYKFPLCPFVILRIARLELAAPIVAETNLVQLLAVTVDVVYGCHLRMLTSLNGILLGRQTICVVAHRMKHIESLQTLVA